MKNAMKTVWGLMASLVVNVLILGTLDWSARQAQLPPAGEVSIVQLSDSVALPAYADARQVDAATRAL
jgi:hypothetical protein